MSADLVVYDLIIVMGLFDLSLEIKYNVLLLLLASFTSESHAGYLFICDS